jgi:hypothetical protein
MTELSILAALAATKSVSGSVYKYDGIVLSTIIDSVGIITEPDLGGGGGGGGGGTLERNDENLDILLCYIII